MDTMTADAAYRRIDDLVAQLQEVIDWADRDDRDYALRTILRDTPSVASNDSRWRAAEFILALDQRRVDDTAAHDAGDDVRVVALHAALVDFMTKLDVAALETATGRRFTDTNDPARDVRAAAAWLHRLTDLWTEGI